MRIQSCIPATIVLATAALACKSGGTVEVTKTEIVHKRSRSVEKHYLQVTIKGPPNAKLDVVEPADSFIETDASGVGTGRLPLHPDGSRSSVKALSAPTGKATLKLVSKSKTLGIESEKTFEAPLELTPGVHERRYGEVFAVGIPCRSKLETQNHLYRFDKYSCKGVEVELNGAPVPGDGGATVDGLKVLSKTTLKDIQSNRGGQPGTPVTLTLKHGGHELSGTIHLEGPAVLRACIEKNVAFGKSKLSGKETGKSSLVWVSRSGLEILGDTNDTVESIDYIAHEGRTNFKRTGCGMYRSAGGASRGMTATSADSKVIVWDARTAKQVGERTFKAPTPRCSKAVSAGASGAGSSSADPKAIRRWLEATFKL